MNEKNDKKFLELCLKYQEQICVLLGANVHGENVFETRGGKVILNFDKNGILQEIETGKVLYKRKKAEGISLS